MDYKDYLQTENWNNNRNRIRKLQSYCLKCGSRNSLNIHHSIYLKDSNRTDVLYTLCEACHHSFHDKYGVKQNMIKETFEYLGINGKMSKYLHK